MSADLTCKPCEGTGRFVCKWPGCEQQHPSKMCSQCRGRGRRLPTLTEWDALVAQRDRLAKAAYDSTAPLIRSYGTEPSASVAPLSVGRVWLLHDLARAALDSDPDLAEHTKDQSR